MLTWWVHEVKVHQVINTQFLQLQHHRAQIRPQNLWIRVVLCQLRGTRETQGTIQNELVKVLIISSCVTHMSTWTETESLGHLKGYLTCLKNSLCHSAWRERISLLKQRTGPLQVHLSQGGCFVRTGYEEGRRQCGLAPSSWNYNSAELGIMEFKEQTLHNRELFQLEGCFGGIQSACGIEECENQTPRRNSDCLVSYLHFCLVSFLCVKAETLSWACSSCTTCPLLGWGLADGCNQKGFHSDTRVIHLIGKGKDRFQANKKAHTRLIWIFLWRKKKQNKHHLLSTSSWQKMHNNTYILSTIMHI